MKGPCLCFIRDMGSLGNPRPYFRHGITDKGGVFPGLPEVQAPHDPLTDLLFLTPLSSYLNNHHRKTHGYFRVPLLLLYPAEFLCKGT